MMLLRQLAPLLVTAFLFVGPALGQTPDVVGVLRQDGVALLLFEWTPQGLEYASRSTAASRYVVRAEDGRRLEVSAASPIDLVDDNHVWGQRTDFGPVIAESVEWPIPRSHYLVSDTAADAPFELDDGVEPNTTRLLAVFDSLAPSSEASLESQRVWRATLDGESAVFFDASRSIRGSNGICLKASGWMSEMVGSPTVQVVESREGGCGGNPGFRPWALVRRNGESFALVELLGPGSSRPQLWHRGPDGIWRVVIG